MGSKDRSGIAWKTPDSRPDTARQSSGAIHVFVTGGTAARREVFAYARPNGRLLRRAVEISPEPASR